MSGLLSSAFSQTSALRFAVGLSKRADTEAAAYNLADEIRSKLGTPLIDLACLFFSSHHAEYAEILASVIHRSLSPRLWIGCNGEGVIAGAEELETTPGVVLWAASLPGVTLAPIRMSFSPTQDQFRMHDRPDPSTAPSSLLLLADPLTIPVREALKLLDEQYPGATAIGGLAGGGQAIGDNRLIFQGDVYTGGLVGVRISGPLAIRPVISQGCRLVGERFVVTRAERNLIHELGGAPAMERLKAVFETLSESERQQARRALHLGIAVDEYRDHFQRGDFLVRHLLGIDQAIGSVAIDDTVQEGQTVQFQLRDAQSASEDFKILLEADRTTHRRPPLGALMFSCCGRGRRLFGKPHHDARAAADRLGAVPLAGFFAQGEIGPVGGRNFLHSYTASMAIFADPDTRMAAGGLERHSPHTGRGGKS